MLYSLCKDVHVELHKEVAHLNLKGGILYNDNMEPDNLSGPGRYLRVQKVRPALDTLRNASTATTRRFFDNKLGTFVQLVKYRRTS